MRNPKVSVFQSQSSRNMAYISMIDAEARAARRKFSAVLALYTVEHFFAAGSRVTISAVSVDLANARLTKIGKITIDGETA